MVLVIILCIFSMIPRILPDVWFVDLFSHFTFQYSFLLFCMLILNFLVFNLKWLYYLIVLVIIHNSISLVPLFLGNDKSESKLFNILSITSINLYSSNYRTGDVVRYVEANDFDIVVFLELTPRWEEELSNLISSYEFKQVVPRKDNFGIAMLSKRELQTQIELFSSTAEPSIIGSIKNEDEALTIIATHPRPPVNSHQFHSRNEHLMKIAERVEEYDDNLILIGDLNLSSYSVHYSRFMDKSGLRDSRKGIGILPTWPTSFRPLFTALDHCLVGGNLIVIDRGTGRHIGSDHLPITIKIGW